MQTDKEFKQVIVVRNDLKLPKGKLAVQVAHASVTAAFEVYKKKKEWFDIWMKQGQRKIVVKVKDLNELEQIYKKAIEMSLPVCIIRDAGLTVVPPGTITCAGIGPAPAELVDKITGHLKLL